MAANPDHDTITALARRLAELGTPRPHEVATEILGALRSRGWRPTPVETRPWSRSEGPPADPEAVHDHAAAARRALADALEAERLHRTPPPGGGR